MSADLWWSMAWGGGIGVLYGVASYLTYLRARRRAGSGFVVVFLGGMVVRLLVALALVALIFALIPVQGPVFIGAFLGVFVIGLVLEIVQVARQGAGDGQR